MFEQDFYRMKFAKNEGSPVLKFSTDYTSTFSCEIARSPPIGADLVAKWVARWRETSFL
jgi:hypothetical protein